MKYSLAIVLCVCSVMTVAAQFLDEKKDLVSFNGFFNFHYSETDGAIYLEVDKLGSEFLFVHSLRTGLGSNDIGIDRGQLGGGEIVKFVRSGNKILLIQPNLEYRATSANAMERRSIGEAFAQSVIFAFPIKETKGNTHVIDLTPFLYVDTHGISRKLKSGKEGGYKLDATRNVVWMERTKAFPKNVEFESMLTYVGEPAGRNIRSVSPNAYSLSFIQHYSFVQLPGPGYVTRDFDPRCGSFSMTYFDYSAPIHEPIKKRLITRHRLKKKNPDAAVSEAVEPIVYYLDPGTPEPVRSALLDGARWWNEAFNAIGYKDAFQVKMLPGDADPMDVRYNVIQWVHRSTRGWSYGSSITDPRTGEIIKGHVSLGSLRIRQDFMIAQALMERPFEARDNNHEQMLELALARIRQLSAHEIGHTLGFAHNFAASTNERASVMDYPHPKIDIETNGKLSFDDAYDVGIGEWDKVSVAYSYGEVPNGVSEKVALNAILEAAFAKGLRFISDSDARARGGAHAKAHLWDNGLDAADELNKVLMVRKIAMNNFSEHNIRTGEPFTVLEDVFVPLYFFHRYQTEAAAKLVGGMDYDYLVKGYNGTKHVYLPKEQQEKALRSIMPTLWVMYLAIPERTLELFPPRAYGYWRSRESFKSDMGVAFDALGAAATSADNTLGLLLDVERANRLIQQKSLEPANLGFEDVLEQTYSHVRNQHDVNTEYQKEIHRMIQYRYLQHLFRLYLNPKALPQVKGIVGEYIDKFESRLRNFDDAFSTQLLKEIAAFRMHPEKFKFDRAPRIPDGSPIGSYQCNYIEP